VPGEGIKVRPEEYSFDILKILSAGYPPPVEFIPERL
jgi:hypothetical protein